MPSFWSVVVASTVRFQTQGYEREMARLNGDFPHVPTVPASVSVEAQDSPVAVDSGSLNLMPTEPETRLKLTQ